VLGVAPVGEFGDRDTWLWLVEGWNKWVVKNKFGRHWQKKNNKKSVQCADEEEGDEEEGGEGEEGDEEEGEEGDEEEGEEGDEEDGEEEEEEPVKTRKKKYKRVGKETWIESGDDDGRRVRQLRQGQKIVGQRMKCASRGKYRINP
jgi:hypothetical protein